MGYLSYRGRIFDLFFDLIDQFFEAGVHFVDIVLLADGVLLTHIVNVLSKGQLLDFISQLDVLDLIVELPSVLKHL